MGNRNTYICVVNKSRPRGAQDSTVLLPGTAPRFLINDVDLDSSKLESSRLTLARHPNILWSPAVLTPTGGPKRESGATTHSSIPELPRSGNRERPAPSH